MTCGGSILNKYQVRLLSRAVEQIDDIYCYISNELKSNTAAKTLVEKLEETVISLEIMPHRFPRRRTGAFANRGYRQVFVKNFTIIYRIDEVKKGVLIVAVKYSRSNF